MQTELPWFLVVTLAIVGACWGSFAATLSERWPQGRSIIHPRSSCDGCGRLLRWADLVPVASYLWTRGRCAACGVEIPTRYPKFEIAGAAVGLICALALPATSAIWGAVLGWQLLLLGVLDAEHFWLPNPLVACLALTGVAQALIQAPEVLIDHTIGGVAGFLSLHVVAAGYRRFRKRDGLGGGDPKLFGAIGFWTGWQALGPILFLAAVMGLIFAVVTSVSDSQRGPMATRRLAFGTWLGAAAWLWWMTGW